MKFRSLLSILSAIGSFVGGIAQAWPLIAGGVTAAAIATWAFAFGLFHVPAPPAAAKLNPPTVAAKPAIPAPQPRTSPSLDEAGDFESPDISVADDISAKRSKEFKKGWSWAERRELLEEKECPNRGGEWTRGCKARVKYEAILRS